MKIEGELKALVEKDKTIEALRRKKEIARAKEDERIAEQKEKIKKASAELKELKKEFNMMKKRIRNKQFAIQMHASATKKDKRPIRRIDQQIRNRVRALAIKLEHKEQDRARAEFRRKYRMHTY